MSKEFRSEREYKRMTQAPVFGLVMRLSIPTAISMLISSIYNIVDTYFVSLLGNSATSAVGVVFSLQSIIQAIGFGFGMGAQSLISRCLGAKEDRRANLYASSGFIASLLMGLAIMIIGLSCLENLMYLMGSTHTALPLACDYGRIILYGAPVFCSSFVLNNILRSEGKATFSMIGLCSGGIINAGLDAIFIFVFKMGVAGAAWATIISQMISFLILLSFFLMRKTVVSVNPFNASRRIKDYWKVFSVGLPTVFRQSLGSIATMLLNIAIRPYGDAAMSAISIANKIYMLLRSMLIGVGQGFQPVAGYNFGAKLYDRVRKAFNSAIIVGSIYCVTAALCLHIFSGEIMNIFREGDSEVIKIGGTMLKYLSISLPVLGYSTFVNQLYQSLGFVVPATVLASCRQGIFFVPLILLLPKCLGLTGIQMTQALSDLITCMVSIPFHIYMLKHNLPKRVTS